MQQFYVARLGAHGWHAQLGHHALYFVYEHTFSSRYLRVGRCHLHIHKKAYRPERWHLGREDWGTAGKGPRGIVSPWVSVYP